jgi:hypothetical protein
MTPSDTSLEIILAVATSPVNSQLITYGLVGVPQNKYNCFKRMEAAMKADLSDYSNTATRVKRYSVLNDIARK